MNLQKSKHKYLPTRFNQLIYSFIHFRSQNLALACLSFILGIITLGNLVLIIIMGLLVLIFPINNISKIICLFIFIISVFNFININNYIYDLSRNSVEIDDFGVLEEPPASNKYSTPLIISTSNTNGKILVQNNFNNSFLYQDKLLVFGSIQNILKSNLDEGYKNFLISKGVLWISKDLNISLVSRGHTISSVISMTRERLIEKVNFELQSPEDSLLTGITVGARSSISEEIKEDLKITGTTHIISVSGYNVALVFSFIMSLAGFINRKKLLYVSIIFLLVYGAVVGFYNLPALRAVIMIQIMIALSIFGKKYEAFSALIISSAFILLIWPLYLINVSFLLSVSATFGIFILSTVVIKFLENIKFNKFFAEIIGSTFAATLSTLPIIIIFFNEVSLLSIPSNLLILPFIPIITILGLIAIILAFIVPLIGTVLFYITERLLEFVVTLLNLLGSIQGSVINRLDMNILLFLIFVALTIFMDYSNFRKSIK